jgi:succinoglycan biosynthesis protein ExoA
VLDGVRKWPVDPGRIEILAAFGTAPSRQRNQAAARAQGDLLVFLDNDSLPAQDWPERLCDTMRAFPEAVLVGGPNVTPRGDGLLQHVFGCALASRLAHAAMACRYRPIGQRRPASEKELILCNLAVRREVFAEAGGFDETLFPNEENEFMNRLGRAGRRLYYDPALRVARSRRQQWRGFVRQMMKYGRGRAEQAFVERFHPANLFFLAPFFFSLYLLSFLLLPTWWSFLPLAGYLLAGLVSGAGFAVAERRPLLALLLPWTYGLMHVAYSAGLVVGTWRRLFRREGSAPDGAVEIVVLKEFDRAWTN